MPLIYQKRIYRSDLKANPDVFYVFGDNVKRKGLGGQAAEMRGEPNAIGIVTKWAPSLSNGAFFTDADFAKVSYIINDDLSVIEAALMAGKTVVWPLDGIGSGLSMLPQKAPALWTAMEAARKTLETIGKQGCSDEEEQN